MLCNCKLKLPLNFARRADSFIKMAKSFTKVAPAPPLHLKNIVCGVELGNQLFSNYLEDGAGGKGGTQKGKKSVR